MEKLPPSFPPLPSLPAHVSWLQQPTVGSVYFTPAPTLTHGLVDPDGMKFLRKAHVEELQVGVGGAVLGLKRAGQAGWTLSLDSHVSVLKRIFSLWGSISWMGLIHTMRVSFLFQVIYL